MKHCYDTLYTRERCVDRKDRVGLLYIILTQKCTDIVQCNPKARNISSERRLVVEEPSQYVAKVT